jgi:oxygen-independent coproporphyrinogen III oxidase
VAGIYIHIPFCKQACTYCNFHFSTSLKLKDEMVRAIATELEMQKNYLEGQDIDTVYFGGGTPSLLSADELNRIFETIQKNYSAEHLQEVTLETNPDDLTNTYIKSLHGTPVNRFSIGVQSFRDEDLQYMNRAHNAQEADYTIKAAQDAGFTNLTIDLIYGTPGLTDKTWKQNLQKVKELQLPHFSSYALTVEEGTALHNNISKKKASPVDNEQSAAQFEILMEQAEAMGYEHYEISNLALPDKYAIHNTNYWRGHNYLGVGPSAHSFDGKNRRWNIANNALYIKSIVADNKLAYEEEQLTAEQRLNEYLMTSLRTMWGCDLEYIERQWGSDTRKTVLQSAEEYIDRKWLVENDNKLILSPNGKLFADRIAGDLFIVS